MKRVEVCARETDVDLIRKVARALVDDERSSGQLRSTIDDFIASQMRPSFKKWLETQPGSSD